MQAEAKHGWHWEGELSTAFRLNGYLTDALHTFQSRCIWFCIPSSAVACWPPSHRARPAPSMTGDKFWKEGKPRFHILYKFIRLYVCNQHRSSRSSASGRRDQKGIWVWLHWELSANSSDPTTSRTACCHVPGTKMWIHIVLRLNIKISLWALMQLGLISSFPLCLSSTDISVRTKRSKNSINQSRRPGCSLGTCTVHVLAHRVHDLNNRLKIGNAPPEKISPLGYGRRRRSVPEKAIRLRPVWSGSRLDRLEALLKRTWAGAHGGRGDRDSTHASDSCQESSGTFFSKHRGWDSSLVCWRLSSEEKAQCRWRYGAVDQYLECGLASGIKQNLFSRDKWTALPVNRFVGFIRPF